MVSVGVVGAGYWGKNHLRILNEIPEANLSLIVEKDDSLAKKYSKLYKVETSQDHRGALIRDDIDAFIICTPNSTHYEIARYALDAGKHILVEKPMCLTSKNAQKLIDLAREQNVVLMAGHVYSYNASVRALFDLIKQDELGKLLFIISSRMGLFPPRPDSGVILDLAIHDIDIITFLLDRRLPDRVFATGRSYMRNKFEEIAFITLEFADDLMAHINTSWLSPMKVRNVCVSGTKKTANLDLIPQQLEIFEQGIEKTPRGAGDEIFDLITRDGMSYKPPIEVREPLKVEDEHFIECIEKNQIPLTDGKIALDAIRVGEAAVRSLKERRYIEI
ncbi:MAG: Gfo/Idh/MocA family protein [Candidatus Heimdallarchaeota archaeon]